jgi:hypothetical protein
VEAQAQGGQAATVRLPGAGVGRRLRLARSLLWRLRGAAAASDPLLLLEVIREAGSRVELSWERRPYGQRTRYGLRGGVIHLRPQVGEKCPAPSGKPCRSTTTGPVPAST